MSYWTGRFIRTEAGEHGRVLDRRVLHRLPRRQLVQLIEAKDVELVAWDHQGEQLELVTDDWLGDDLTHVSVSAADASSWPSSRPVLAAAAGVACVLAVAGAVLTLSALTAHARPLRHHPAARPTTAALAITTQVSQGGAYPVPVDLVTAPQAEAASARLNAQLVQASREARAGGFPLILVTTGLDGHTLVVTYAGESSARDPGKAKLWAHRIEVLRNHGYVVVAINRWLSAWISAHANWRNE
jgi:hypothetical protein